MSYLIRPANNPVEWNQFIERESPFCFTQSWEWGEVLRGEGRLIDRYVVERDGKPVAYSQHTEQQMLFGWRYAIKPHGPVLSSGLSTAEVEEVYRFLCANKKLVFARIEPSALCQSSNVVRVHDVNPSTTTVLDLRLGENDLLAKMHQKTRYNIHLAEKKGVEVREEKNEDLLWRLTQATARRDGFRSHGRAHYRHVLASPISMQFVAYHGGQPIATAVCIKFGSVFTYLYGASDYHARNLMAPYILQWKGICRAKQDGFSQYDFFGIAPKQGDSTGEEYRFDPRHQYAGITRFKLGFGGSVVTHPGTWDLILQPKKYKVYQFLRKGKHLLSSFNG